MKGPHRCRYCRGTLVHILSLGKLPLVNYFPTKSEAARVSKYPLDLLYCPACSLAQTGVTVPPPELFETYHYVTGASTPLVAHLSHLAQTCVRDFHLKKGARVLDIGANDGTLLLAFQAKGMKVLGVEPGRNVAAIAQKRGIPVRADFFSFALARKIRKKQGQFDLITATHTLANIPDLGDFFDGVEHLLTPNGTLVLEVASLEEMIRRGQFDAMYHEHYWYFSFVALTKLLSEFGLTITSAGIEPAQGGSILLFAQKGKHLTGALPPIKPLTKPEFTHFAQKVTRFRWRFLRLMASLQGKTVVGFGAPAKGVTLLNYCRMGPEDIAFVVDSTPEKQGKFVPGTGIPVFAEGHLSNSPVDALLILSWNYKEEILKKIKKIVRHPVTVIVPFPILQLTKVSL